MSDHMGLPSRDPRTGERLEDSHTWSDPANDDPPLTRRRCPQLGDPAHLALLRTDRNSRHGPHDWSLTPDSTFRCPGIVRPWLHEAQVPDDDPLPIEPPSTETTLRRRLAEVEAQVRELRSDLVALAKAWPTAAEPPPPKKAVPTFVPNLPGQGRPARSGDAEVWGTHLHEVQDILRGLANGGVSWYATTPVGRTAESLRRLEEWRERATRILQRVDT